MGKYQRGRQQTVTFDELSDRMIERMLDEQAERLDEAA